MYRIVHVSCMYRKYRNFCVDHTRWDGNGGWVLVEDVVGADELQVSFANCDLHVTYAFFARTVYGIVDSVDCVLI